jgi:predicted nucleic acid-binding protein
MKFVLDASVALKWVLPEPDATKALSLRDQHRLGVHDLIAPETFAIEVAHGLTRAERRGILVPQQAMHQLRNVLSVAPKLYPFLPLLLRAVELSSQARIGVYDCLYVALAEQEQCDLVTADQRLAALGHPQVTLLAYLP